MMPFYFPGNSRLPLFRRLFIRMMAGFAVHGVACLLQIITAFTAGYSLTLTAGIGSQNKILF